MAQMVKRLPTMRETQVQSLGREDPLEKEMAAHSSTIAWKIPWTEELVGYSPWDHKESDITEWLHFPLSDWYADLHKFISNPDISTDLLTYISNIFTWICKRHVPNKLLIFPPKLAPHTNFFSINGNSTFPVPQPKNLGFILDAPLLGGTSSKELVCQWRRCLERQVQSLGRDDPLKKGMATHFSILAWKIPWTEEPGRQPSMRPQRVGHDWSS